jgi:putative transposase
LRSAPCELDDALWAEIAALLPAPRRRGTEPLLAYRVMLEGILWVARTGASWHDLPDRFGPPKTVYATYHRWKQHGQWPAVLARLQAAATAST